MTSRARAPQRQKQSTLLDHFQSSSSPIHRSTRSMLNKSIGTVLKAKSPVNTDDESDPEILEVTPIKTRSSRATKVKGPTKSPAKQSRLRSGLNSSRMVKRTEESDSSGSDIAQIKFEPKRRSSSSLTDGSDTVIKPHNSKRRRIASCASEDEQVPLEENDLSDSKGVGVRWLSGKRKAVLQISDSESGVDKSSPRKLVRGTRPEPQSDSEDLDGIDEDRIIESRLRGNPKKLTGRQKLLEKLKAKSKHYQIRIGTFNHASEGNKTGETFSDSDDKESSSDAENEDIIPGARPDDAKNEHSISEDEDNDDSEEDENDFIVDDGDQPPTAVLPSAFSMDVHQDMSHHFKVVCQFFVHIAVTKPRKRSHVTKSLLSQADEYFSLPLFVLRRKLSGIRDSITSSVWRPAFTKALQRYPEFNLTELDFAVPYCDACHLGGRMSKLIGRVGGDLYDIHTFEPLSNNETNAVQAISEDSLGEYHLGRFCARRTRIYHELSHWEYSVFRNLEREVDEISNRNGARKFVRISHSGGVAPPSDPADADAVLEWLDDRGVIDIEWTRIKQLISNATRLDFDARKSGADD